MHYARNDAATGGAEAAGHRDSKDSGLTAAAVVGHPFDMLQATRKLKRRWTMPWMYNLVLTFRCAPSTWILPFMHSHLQGFLIEFTCLQSSGGSKSIHSAAAAVVGHPFGMMQASWKLKRRWPMPWIYYLVLTFRCAPQLLQIPLHTCIASCYCLNEFMRCCNSSRCPKSLSEH
jgi:hypothetical protein